MIKLNTAETPEYRKQYQVAGLPTVVLVKADGEEIDRTLGYVETDEFISTMDNYQKGIGTLASMMSEEDAKGNDPEFLKMLGEKLYAHSMFADADERFAGVIKLDSTNAAGLAADAQLLRARSSAKLENYPLAVAFCEALIKRWPDSELLPDATIYAGYYSDQAGQTDKAVRIYKEYMEKWPKGEDAEWAAKQVEKLTAPPSDDE